MLGVKVWITQDDKVLQLEEMQIINTGEKLENGDTIYQYKCKDIEFKVYHNRHDGWEVLLYKVMKIKVEVMNKLLAMNLRELIKL